MANLLKNFTLQKVISDTSPEVLQEYFHSKNLLQEIEDFPKFKKNEKAENYKIYISDKILELQSDPGRVISDFQKVITLTREKALQSLFVRMGYIEKYKHLINDINTLQIENNYDKVFYFLGKEPEFIKQFYLIFSLKSHTESYWNRRHTDIITRHKDITADEIASLKEAIQETLKKTGRGHNCNIQHIIFDGKDHLFVMAEDTPMTMPLWRGNIAEEELIKPCFDVAFVYDRHEGALDICCIKGGAPFKNKMQLAFSKAALGKEITELQEDDEVYDLENILQQLLNNKKVDFHTSVGKNINDIFIRSMRLKGKNFRNSKPTLDTGLNDRYSEEQDDIYSELVDFTKINEVSTNTVDIHDLEISWLECRVIYYDETTKENARKKFNISGRSGCNLGFENVDKEIRECLKKAKIQLPRAEDAKQQAA